MKLGRKSSGLSVKATSCKSGQIPFSPLAKKVLEGALKEAQGLGHRYIGTEHILLGLARLDEGTGARILLDVNVDAERIRRETIGQMNRPDYAERAEAEASWTGNRRALTGRSAPVDAVGNQALVKTVGELIVSLPESDKRGELEVASETAIRALTVGQLLEAVRYTKETYIEDGDFEPAARFRDIERRLVRAIEGAQSHGA